MRYTVILEQEPDGGYVATVPALPGCVSQGDTRDDVLKNRSRRIVGRTPWSAAGPLAGSLPVSDGGEKSGTRASRADQGGPPY